MKDQKINIAIIDCALKQKELESFAQLKHRIDEINFSYFSVLDPDCFSQLKNQQNQMNGYIIFGSISNVEERLPWHKLILDLVIPELNLGKSILGICFGHQLMSDYFGAKVVKRSAHRQGIYKLNVTKKYQADLGESLNLIFEHSFEVINPSDDFELVASSGKGQNDILIHKRLPYMGVQAHPEAVENFISRFKDQPTSEQLLLAKDCGEKLIKWFYSVIKCRS